MPLHEYRCSDCGKQFEELVDSENWTPVCSCGSTKTIKLISGCFLNTWSVDYSQMNGEKERIDAGMYE